MKKDLGKDDAALQKVPSALKELLGTVDQELDKQQQAIETLETAIKKDMESVVAKLAKERGYSVVFHKYRMNVSADDITGDVIAGLKKLEYRTKAAEALNKRVAGSSAGEKSK
jgi:Skp family chaperone for outer membrane proteins